MTTTARLLLPASLFAVLCADASAQSWTQLTPTWNPAPPTSYHNDGAASSDFLGVVVFGGRVGSSPSSDTWRYQGGTWTQLSPALSPPARYGHAMCLDTNRLKVILFAGHSGIGPARHNDTWEFDPFTDTWTQITPYTTVPTGRSGHSMAFDSHRGVCLAFGYNPGGNTDTWQYGPVAGVPGAFDWTLVDSGGMAGAGGYGGKMMYDKARQAMVYYGGWNGSGYIGHHEFDPSTNTWTDRSSEPTMVLPTGRSPAMGVYDERRNRCVIYGGYQKYDTWEFNGTAWVQTLPGSGAGTSEPFANRSGAYAYDANTQSTLYFGGYDSTHAHDNETWTYTGVRTAIAAPFGHGCPTSAGTPSLMPLTAPMLGSSYDLEITLGAAPVALLSHGFSNENGPVLGSLPIELGPYGMPGCTLYVDPIGSFFLAASGGTATANLALPNAAYLAGLRFFSQALVPDAAAANGIGGLTNAVHGFVGL